MNSKLEVVTKSLADATQILLNLLKTNLLLVSLKEAVEGKEKQVGLVLVILVGHFYYRRKHSYWSRRNVKTPKLVLPLFGNLHSFFYKSKQELQLEWPKQYGKVYGFYMGTRPYLVCADAHVLKKICIKDFDKFPNHYLVSVRNKYQDHFLIMQQDDHWRSMRAILSPTFASGKIKIIHRQLENCTNELVQICMKKVELEGEKNIAIKRLFSEHSMSCALTSFYGLEANSNSKREFALRSSTAIVPSYPRFIIASILPDSVLKFFNIPLIKESNMDFFAHNARKIIEQRQNSREKQHHKDYLQLILEARADSQYERAQSDQHESHHTLSSGLESWRPSKMRLNEMEVSCQAMMLMMVATETTSTLLSHTVYLLAHHLEVQAKLFEELQKLNGAFDYENLTQCTYLDCVISESLRLMSPALALDRVASEDYYIEEYDIHVPKGTVINLDFYAILHDPDYWPQPDQFLPDRFKAENKANIVPGSYCPFGIGPRACIGFRFALTEAKTTIAKLITEFKFKSAPGTIYPPKPELMSFILNTNKDLIVTFERRQI